MYELVKRLYPIPRSILNEGFVLSLNMINEDIGGGYLC